MDARTGERPDPAVDADPTTRLALPETGLGDVGPVRLADIGLPRVGLPNVVFERTGVEYEWSYREGVSVELSVR